MRTPLLLAVLLGLHAVAADTITKEYGFCPKYAIQSGDTIFQLAEKLNVTTEALTEAATGCGADLSLLQIDQEICLPGYNSTICTHVLETDPDRPWCQVYEVQDGDTITSVAALFNITEEDLVDLNADYLEDGWALPYAGQYVRMPGWNQKKCRDFNDNDTPDCQMYVVQAGDSATMIAQKFKVSLEDMLELNELNDTDALQPNFKLKIPEWNETCPPEGIPAVVPADTVDCRVTQLGEGESLALLAEEYSTSVQDIQKVNPTLKNVTTLQPGIYVNLPPFPRACVGNGNLVDVAGESTVPEDFDYNGLKGPIPISLAC
ncbi:hypothetical protein CHLNCDRAFT_59444 [Chlorella variabilis]|uniref:LysM domain-containing protein n=1 Tax=Chlorella variabilis TaxID=554065 RepID=E1ZTV5_CHLVA|nr:hypothetical protein CHLNCDRAFT_59444 [Chlorella variabilis]EFN50746.1 hypothetical protein CHLNCDRAFT_59444 [Chlorella variabilis]|eukprot:XP_005842858.1 hypothetical protein CHLNCDRAFT_59444 [Chlorella variabilis]